MASTIVVVLLAAVALFIGTVGAQEAGDVRLKSVRFDIDQPANETGDPLSPAATGPVARYRSLVVVDRGQEHGLEPLTGTVSVSLTQTDAAAMAAELDGLRIGPAAADLPNALADGASSSSVHRFVRFTPTGTGGPVSLELVYSRPLMAGDYLLIQEGGGDSPLDLTAVDADGTAIGKRIMVGPGYQWNTGHGSEGVGASWASVIGVDGFDTGGRAIAGIRVAGFEAEFKVVALAPAGPSETTPPPTGGQATSETKPAPASEPASGEPASGEPAEPQRPPPGEKPAQAPTPTTVAETFAAIGLESKIQPAIAVGGAGCADPSPGANPLSLAAGQSATFCFTVTNLGTTNLTDIGITDPELGLVNAVLPKATGPSILEPGQKAVFYHHTVIADAGPQISATVTARPADVHGSPIAGLAAPTGSVGEQSPVPSVSTGSADSPTEAPSTATASATDGARSGTPVPARSAQVPVTQLALTGMATEPWVLVIFAMAFIFIGYTAYAAFRHQSGGNEVCGHDQLDAFGFD